MRLIDADKFKEDLLKLWDYNTVDGITATTVLKQVISDLDNATTVEEPKYFLKVKNLTAEDKKRFQECWNKSAGGLLVIPDNYEIIPIERLQGTWIFNDEICQCPFCFMTQVLPYNYCPNCGAKLDSKEG